MSNLVNHAERELNLAGFLSEDEFYGGNTGKAVLELMEVFSKQGHSGNSAPLVANLFNKLANFETIMPVTGQDDEWYEVGKGLYQNNRNSAVFKENGRAYYIDGMVKRTDKACWTGSFYKDKESFENRAEENKIASTRAYIKSFPFTPKTFYIDCEEVEVEKDDWEMYAKNPEQLKEVAEYYDLV